MKIPCTALAVLSVYSWGAMRPHENEHNAVILGAEVKNIHDSNFTRTPDPESERITIASADLNLDVRVSKQSLSGRVHSQRYDYQNRDALNTTIWGGRVNWNSNWSDSLGTRAVWRRDATRVDQFEFPGDDTRILEQTSAYVTWQLLRHARLVLGAGNQTQEHTNPARAYLEFDEEYVDLGWEVKSRKGSSLILSMIAGERIYAVPELGPMPRDLNYDYRDVQVEAHWVVSPKTTLQFSTLYFDRQGTFNDGSGLNANVTAEWQVTAKVFWQTGLEYRQPPIGESRDSPTEVRSLSSELTWQLTTKITMSNSLRYSQLTYERDPTLPDPDESLRRFKPLSLRYEPVSAVQFNAGMEWLERDSSAPFRDYRSRQFSLSIRVSF